MNAGELDNKISILTLTSEESGTDTVYTWSVSSRVWAKIETPEGYTTFSRLGKGERTVKFTIRKTPLDLTNAILWGDKHCFITHVAEVGRMFYEITTALVEPKTCTYITYSTALNALNWPVQTESASLTFPGYLAERFSFGESYEQKKPMAETTERLALVTPKVIMLEAGALIQAGTKHYTVTAVHDLDGCKNEYELIKKGDA